VKTEILSKPFGGSIKLTGEAAGLRGMTELIASRFKLNVVHAGIPYEWNGVKKNYLTAAALIAEGTENCVKLVRPAPPIIKLEPVTGGNEDHVNGAATGSDARPGGAGTGTVTSTGKRGKGKKMIKNFIEMIIPSDDER
ncbi:MAG: hypothetical protein LBF85_07900, partial [Tannerella sp.]|jgi:cell division ATPase FtsA|nr:hypothetical protein [Tannerella sp.]